MQVPDYVFNILLQDCYDLEEGESLNGWASIIYPSADRNFLRKVISDLYREVDFRVVRADPELKPDEYEIYRLKSDLNPFS